MALDPLARRDDRRDLACGLSGSAGCGTDRWRSVLELRFETADGRQVKGGGPTVKNVTGYDLPRLFVGSLGTSACSTGDMRCRPAAGDGSPAPDERLVSTVGTLWTREAVLFEGVAADVDAQGHGLTALAGPPAIPDGPHRGRISVAPGRVRACAAELEGRVRWCAEVGVGTVHIAADESDGLAHARSVAHAHGGWMLREAGGPPGDDGYGRALPNASLMRRVTRER
jgi:hypothetical protein